MVARSKNSLQTVADQVEGEVLPVRADITDATQVSAAFPQVRDKFGPVDILINHASYARGRDGSICLRSNSNSPGGSPS